MAVTARRKRTWWVLPAVVALIAAGCGSATHPSSSRSSRGGSAPVEVVGPWSGVEQERFLQVMAGFEQETGERVRYVSAPNRVRSVVDAERAAGHPPAVAFLPQPGLLRQYVADGVLLPLDPAAVAEVRQNYSQVWSRLASVNGRLYGVWFKAADKSLIWYDIAAFERAGVVPPGTIDGLLALAGSLRRSGIAPFAVGGLDGWTLTDWFENLYLTLEGPQRYDLLAGHHIPWTDDSVKQTLREMAELLSPANMAGGVTGTLTASFDTSVTETFGPRPRAAMVSEGDFVAGAITGTTAAQLGVDADVFPFPSNGAPVPAMVGGGDVAVLMSTVPGAAALIRYLATPAAGAIWARLGGFISPNLNVAPASYPDAITRSIAVSVLDSGNSFRFDLSDLQPAQFGATPGQGMFQAFQDFLAHRDVEATAARLEADAAAAYR